MRRGLHLRDKCVVNATLQMTAIKVEGLATMAAPTLESAAYHLSHPLLFNSNSNSNTHTTAHPSFPKP